MDNTIQKLTDIFIKFPGIGPKQAKRFVYYLLNQDKNSLERLAKLITELKNEITQCTECYRYFPKDNKPGNICNVCSDSLRDHTQLMLVEKDIDLDNIKKSGIYRGLFFVLGGAVPILDKDPLSKIRGSELLEVIKRKINDKDLTEIILAMNATTEGDHTADFLRDMLDPLVKNHNIKISVLGRGLSTGTELEYVDNETMKNALLNRHSLT